MDDHAIGVVKTKARIINLTTTLEAMEMESPPPT